MTRNKESMLDCQMGFAILTGLFERMRGLKDPRFGRERRSFLRPAATSTLWAWPRLSMSPSSTREGSSWAFIEAFPPGGA